MKRLKVDVATLSIQLGNCDEGRCMEKKCGSGYTTNKKGTT